MYNHGNLQGEELVEVRGGKKGLKRLFYFLNLCCAFRHLGSLANPIKCFKMYKIKFTR